MRWYWDATLGKVVAAGTGSCVTSGEIIQGPRL